MSTQNRIEAQAHAPAEEAMSDTHPAPTAQTKEVRRPLRGGRRAGAGGAMSFPVTHEAVTCPCGATTTVEIEWGSELRGANPGGAPSLEPVDGDACSACGEQLGSETLDALRHAAEAEAAATWDCE